MPLSILFWILMLFWLIFGGIGWHGTENRSNWGLGGFLVTWLAVAVLGWKVFGGFVQG